MRFTVYFSDGTGQTFVKNCSVQTAYAIAKLYAKERKKKLMQVMVNG